MPLILSHKHVIASLKALDDDIKAHPDQLTPLEPAVVQRARDLVRGVEVDLEAPLREEDE